MAEETKKEFLRIDVLAHKLGMSRKQVGLARRRGEIPLPIISTPPTWRVKDIDEFYDLRAKKNIAGTI